MSTQNQAPSFATLRIIWGAILSSTVMFLVVLGVIDRPDELENAMLLPIFGFVAASTAVSAVAFPEFLLRQTLTAKKGEIPTTEVPDPTAPPGFGKQHRVPSNPEAAHRSVLAAYSTKTILGCALSEAVCIFGFVLGFLGVSLPWVLPFFVVGWLAMGYNFPSEAKMLDSAARALGIKF